MEPTNIIYLVTFGCYAVWQYLRARGDKTGQRLEEITKRYEAIEKDLISLQASIRGSLRYNDLARVYDSINRLSEQVNKMDGEFKSQAGMLRAVFNRITEKGMS